MAVNTEMFQRVYDQIVRHPESHDQGLFETYSDCGTKRCIAGWAVALEYGVELNGSIFYGAAPAYAEVEGREVDGDGIDGYLSETAVLAADVLGLTDEQAHDLFYEMDNEVAVAKCLAYAEGGA